MQALARTKRRRRIRSRISGSVDRPRAAVYRSLTGISVQLIDDASGKTLYAMGAGKKKSGKKKSGKTQEAHDIGVNMGKLAIEKGVNQIVFDRGGYAYHGRVKALADGMREGGLEF